MGLFYEKSYNKTQHLLLELIGKNKGIKIRLCTKYVTMKLQEMYVCNAMYESHGKAEKHFKISH